MRAAIPVLLAVLAMLCAAVLPGCYEGAVTVVCINDRCEAEIEKSADGAAHVKVGYLIEWCNRSSGTVVIRFTDRKILGGMTTLRLSPGERVIRRVGTLTPGRYDWTFFCAGSGDDTDTDGRSGGPVIVDPKP
jgi:hypothetical protein